MMRFSLGVSFIASIPFMTRFRDDLLKLDAVAEDRKRIRCDHTNHFDFTANGMPKKSDGFLRDFVEVEFFSSNGAFFSRLRILRMTSLARRSSCKMSFTISLSSAMSGVRFRICD